MLTCYLTRRRLGAHLDGALDPHRSRTVTAHLEACPACRQEEAQLRRLRSHLQGLREPAVPDWTGFWPGIVRGIQDGRDVPVAREAGSRPGWQPRWAVGGALAAALIAALTLWPLMPGPTDVHGRVLVSSATTDDPRATVMVYSTPGEDVAVVWLFGVD